MEVCVKIVSTFEARTHQEANGASDRKRAILLLCVSLCCLLIAACTSAPARPVLGAFTGDERELAYLEQVRALSPASLRDPESVHLALSVYRDIKGRQQSLFVQLYRQYPDATPREMSMLVRHALDSEKRADLVAMPVPSFQCSTVTRGKREVLSCN